MSGADLVPRPRSTRRPGCGSTSSSTAAATSDHPAGPAPPAPAARRPDPDRSRSAACGPPPGRPDPPQRRLPGLQLRHPAPRPSPHAPRPPRATSPDTAMAQRPRLRPITAAAAARPDAGTASNFAASNCRVTIHSAHTTPLCPNPGSYVLIFFKPGRASFYVLTNCTASVLPGCRRSLQMRHCRVSWVPGSSVSSRTTWRCPALPGGRAAAGHHPGARAGGTSRVGGYAGICTVRIRAAGELAVFG